MKKKKGPPQNTDFATCNILVCKRRGGGRFMSSKKVIADVDERPRAARFAEEIDQDFALLVQELDGRRGGFAQ